MCVVRALVVGSFCLRLFVSPAEAEEPFVKKHPVLTTALITTAVFALSVKSYDLVLRSKVKSWEEKLELDPATGVLIGAAPFSHRGSETGVLVLHGYGGTACEVRPLGEYLAAQGFTVEVPNLPGHDQPIFR